MLCYVNQVHFTLKIKTGASTCFLRVNHTTAGFLCLRGVGCLWTEQGTVGGWGVFTYYQRRRKQGSGRKGGIKERWRKERLGWCISDDRATSSRRWPVQETAHFYSDGGELGMGGAGVLAALSARLTPPPVRSDCGTDVNRQAQTSAGC